jgi:two-component system OmpR family response regulator
MMENFMVQKHALIIDDNGQNRRVLAQLLTKQGASYTEVADPRALPDLLASVGPVDVVFLDLEMPGQDGYSVKDLLRSWLGETPIIAYTVHISEMMEVKKLGFDGFLGKPLDTSRFPEQFSRILSGKPVWERA